jgi:hypothetical protein
MNIRVWRVYQFKSRVRPTKLVKNTPTFVEIWGFFYSYEETIEIYTCKDVESESSSWLCASLRVPWEQWTCENSQTTFSFRRKSKLLLVLIAKIWQQVHQLFVNTLQCTCNFSTVRSLTRQASPSRSKSLGYRAVALVRSTNKRRNKEKSTGLNLNILLIHYLNIHNHMN